MSQKIVMFAKRYKNAFQNNTLKYKYLNKTS